MYASIRPQTGHMHPLTVLKPSIHHLHLWVRPVQKLHNYLCQWGYVFGWLLAGLHKNWMDFNLGVTLESGQEDPIKFWCRFRNFMGTVEGLCSECHSIYCHLFHLWPGSRWIRNKWSNCLITSSMYTVWPPGGSINSVKLLSVMRLCEFFSDCLAAKICLNNLFQHHIFIFINTNWWRGCLRYFKWCLCRVDLAGVFEFYTTSVWLL